MKTYITQLVKGYFVSYQEEIDAEYWAGQIGSTYQDFLEGKWVLLSDEQVAFRNRRPYASVKEVWDMELHPTPTPERTLEIAKDEKKADIEEYNDSNNVNDFTVNNALHSWLTPTERANYRNSVDSAKTLGLADVSLFVGDMPLTLPTATAEQMLAQIQLYADQCYMVTKRHLLAVDALETIEEVDEYDYTTGYPLKLNFEVEV